MREVIQCLIDWLNSVPSDEKAHRILQALAKESLKKATFADDKRRFTGEEIVEAAFENTAEEKPDNPNKWINWNGTVLKYWETRENQIIELAQKRSLKSYPKPERKSTSGYHQTTYLIKAEPLTEINNAEQSTKSQSEKASSQTDIHYERSEVKPAWIARWLFRNGQIQMRSWHIWSILSGLFMLGGSTVVLSLLIWLALSVPQPVTTRELCLFITIFVFPYIIWIAFIRPWVYLFDDRIIIAPALLINIKEKTAQLELFRDGDLRLFRLVGYSAPCPICGATIYLENGDPDYPRRLIGRCYDSPREHIFSFDRVTQRGVALRSPFL